DEKSTNQKRLADIEAPDEGRVMHKKDLTIGFLDQHGGLESKRTILEEMKHVFAPVLANEKQVRAIEQKMALESSTDDASFQETLKEYTRLQEAFERQNGYGYRSEIK